MRPDWSMRLGIRAVVVLLLLFVVSCFKSCEEVTYWRKGEVVDATVTSIDHVIGRRGRQTNDFKVRYTFSRTDNDHRSRGHTIVGAGKAKAYTPRQRIQIEYLTKPALRTRIVGTHNTFWLVFLALSLLGMAGVGVWLWICYRQTYGPAR